MTDTEVRIAALEIQIVAVMGVVQFLLESNKVLLQALEAKMEKTADESCVIH